MSFTPELFSYLADLAEHNDRDWFSANKHRYEAHLKAPALALIEQVKPGLTAVSPHLRVDAKALFRIHRDTRFSNDKTPYKTHCGLHFRHDAGADAHAPGVYLHLANDGCFLGVGIWQPPTPAIQAIRRAILDDGEGWAAVDASMARAGFTAEGASLTRAPRGVPADHPQVTLLRRKDHIGVVPVSFDAATSPALADEVVRLAGAGAPLMARLCGALGVPW